MHDDVHRGPDRAGDLDARLLAASAAWARVNANELEALCGRGDQRLWDQRLARIKTALGGSCFLRARIEA